MKADNQLTAQNGQGTFSMFLGKDAVQKQLLNALKNPREIQKFTSSICSAVSTNPALQDCDYGTIVSSGLLANALNLSLSPQLGFCYMIPFDDKKRGRKVATFVLGYRGYIQLAIRSGYYKKLNVLAVKEGELVSYNPLTEEIEVQLIEDEELRENAATTGYYAMFEYASGFRKAMYWSRKKMELHADKYSKAFSAAAFKKLQAGEIPQADQWKYSSFWYKDFDGMAIKTMIRQLISKWGVMSIDLQAAFDAEKEALTDETTGVEELRVQATIAAENGAEAVGELTGDTDYAEAEVFAEEF